MFAERITTPLINKLGIGFNDKTLPHIIWLANTTIFLSYDLVNSFYYFQIRDGGGFYANMVGQYCGNVAPLPILSTSNMLWIRFYTDGTTEGAGAIGTLEAVDCKEL